MRDIEKVIINPAVWMSFLNFGFKLVFKFSLIVLIPWYLTPMEMGYWYTFISVAALTTFADLGFTTIITQFSAHETAILNFDTGKRDFENKDVALGNISSLFLFSIKWAGFFTIVCSICIFLIGIKVFSKSNVDSALWLVPWAIYAVASALDFFNQVVLSFFEGCNQIVTSQKIKIVNGIVVNGLGLLGLSYGYGLYSLAIPMAFGVVVSYAQIFGYYNKVIFRMLRCRTYSAIKWFTEIIKLLWKYAISWGSGYLIFQIYSPLVFSLYGPEAAGKVGYMLTIIGVFVTVANVWSYVSVPQMNILNEQKRWDDMDVLFKKNMLLIIGTFVLEIVVCVLAQYLPYISEYFSKYIFSLKAFSILSLGYVGQLAISYIAVYLRSNKEEPLMVTSIISAILSVIATLFCLKCLPFEFVFCGYSFSVFVVLPFILKIKSDKSRMWRNCKII